MRTKMICLLLVLCILPGLGFAKKITPLEDVPNSWSIGIDVGEIG